MNRCEEKIQESGALGLSDSAWAEAGRRAEVICRLAEREMVSTSVAAEAARTLHLSERTIYSLIKRWRETDGSVPALIGTPY